MSVNKNFGFYIERGSVGEKGLEFERHIDIKTKISEKLVLLKVKKLLHIVTKLC